jgi:hypothetical protein
VVQQFASLLDSGDDVVEVVVESAVARDGSHLLDALDEDLAVRKHGFEDRRDSFVHIRQLRADENVFGGCVNGPRRALDSCLSSEVFVRRTGEIIQISIT